MESNDFDFRVGEIDGFRLIEITYPPRIDHAAVAAAAARFFSLLEGGGPAVTLNDVSRIGALTDDIRMVQRTVFRRTRLEDQARGAVWYTGDNPQLAAAFRDFLGELPASASPDEARPA